MNFQVINASCVIKDGIITIDNSKYVVKGKVDSVSCKHQAEEECNLVDRLKTEAAALNIVYKENIPFKNLKHLMNIVNGDSYEKDTIGTHHYDKPDTIEKTVQNVMNIPKEEEIEEEKCEKEKEEIKIEYADNWSTKLKVRDIMESNKTRVGAIEELNRRKIKTARGYDWDANTLNVFRIRNFPNIKLLR